MARVTVEDCIEVVPNRFDLVLLAAHRGRSISAGVPLTVDRDNDKNPVVALREIAERTISADALHEGLIQSLQRHVEVDEPEEENTEIDLEMLPSLEDVAIPGESKEDALAGALADIEADYGNDEVAETGADGTERDEDAQG